MTEATQHAATAFVLTDEPDPARPGALNLGALALVRSLGRRGVPVVRVHPNALERGLRSAFCREVEVCPALCDSEERLLHFLLKMARRYAGQRLLLPASEDAACFVSRYHRALGHHYEVALPGWPALQALLEMRSQRKPGPDEPRMILLAYLDAESRPLAYCMQRRQGSAPTASCHERRIESLSIRLLRNSGYHGLCSLEWTLDPRTQNCELVGITPGAPESLALAPACGVDLAWVAYLDKVGWRAERVTEWRDGITADLLFAHDDVMPFLSQSWAALRTRIARLFGPGGPSLPLPGAA